MDSRHWLVRFVLGLLAIFRTSATPAAARKILVMGDSQSEEYAFEAGPEPLSPDRTRMRRTRISAIGSGSWRRNARRIVFFGSYRSDAYSELRGLGGFAYNSSVPGAETGDMVDVIESTIFKNPWYLTSKNQIIDQLEDAIAYVVVFLGANDVRSMHATSITTRRPPDSAPRWRPI